MVDLLQDCMEDFRQKAEKLKAPVLPADFQDVFCAKCKNPECVHAGFGDPMATRVATQLERLTQPTQADPKLPKYKPIVTKEWEDMAQQALRLELSSRRGDWEVPDDLSDEVRDLQVEDVVQQLVKNTTPQKPVAVEDPDPSDLEDFKEEEKEKPDKKPAPQYPKAHPTFRPDAGNTPIDPGGILLPGAPSEPPHKTSDVDPWAPPSKQPGGRKIAVGATIKLNKEGEIIDE